MFKGSIVALVTPMQADGTIDKNSLAHLIEWHITSGTDAIVIAGTTGESATLTEDEQVDLISTAVKLAKGRIPIIAGTGSNSTAHTIKLSQLAKKADADGALVVTPYYNKPTQKGLIQHYKMVAEKANFPIILYNVPGRTACDLLPETVAELAKIPNIVGIKEATGKLERAEEISKQCPADFCILSGDDSTALDLFSKGATGIISVTANIAPKKMADLCKAALAQNFGEAKLINDELMPLHRKLFLESNPIPTKWLMNKMGLIPSGIRLPLLPLDQKYHGELEEALRCSRVDFISA